LHNKIEPDFLPGTITEPSEVIVLSFLSSHIPLCASRFYKLPAESGDKPLFSEQDYDNAMTAPGGKIILKKCLNYGLTFYD